MEAAYKDMVGKSFMRALLGLLDPTPWELWYFELELLYVGSTRFLFVAKPVWLGILGL